MFSRIHVQVTTIVIVLALLPTGCATTRQARSVEKSGFLGDYSMLEEGKDDSALLLFVDESADWSVYDKVRIESVTIWTSDATKDIGSEEAQILSDHFYNALHKQLSKVIEVVPEQGPNTLRLRAAITGGEDAAVVADVITTTIPQLRMLSTLVGMAAKTSVFVGEATAEAEITDSLTNRRLAAGVDRRIGTKTFKGMTSDWADVEGALDVWAERIARRVAEQKGVEFPDA
jgi:hypothetical protein